MREPSSRGLKVRVPSKTEFLNDASRNEVFLDNPLQHVGRARVIPDALGINHCDRATCTHAKAVRFGPVNGIGQAQFLKAAFEVVPGAQAKIELATLRVGLIRAKQDMATVSLESRGLCYSLKVITHDTFARNLSRKEELSKAFARRGRAAAQRAFLFDIHTNSR